MERVPAVRVAHRQPQLPEIRERLVVHRGVLPADAREVVEPPELVNPDRGLDVGVEERAAAARAALPWTIVASGCREWTTDRAVATGAQTRTIGVDSERVSNVLRCPYEL